MQSHFSLVQLFVTLWTVAHQAPQSKGFSRQELWSGLPFPPPGDLPDPGIKPTSLVSPALVGWSSLPLVPPGKLDSQRKQSQRTGKENLHPGAISWASVSNHTQSNITSGLSHLHESSSPLSAYTLIPLCTEFSDTYKQRGFNWERNLLTFNPHSFHKYLSSIFFVLRIMLITGDNCELVYLSLPSRSL